MSIIDPLTILSVIFMQIGSRHLDIELTPLQKKMLKNKYVQFVILFSIIYITTRSFIKTFIIIGVLYIFLFVLFNENHKLNIISINLLHNEGLISKYNIKEIYYNTLNNLI